MFSSRFSFALALCALTLLPRLAAAQAPLVTSDFEGAAFPDAGWAVFDNGVATQAPWLQFYDDVRENNYAYAPPQSAPPGERAEDYLATPQFSPTPDKYTLSFDVGQRRLGLDQAEFAVLVSTASQTDPADYTVIASYSEDEIGVAWAYMYRFTIDLSAYIGTPIYVAFRNQQNGDDGIYLDNVWIGPDVAAHVDRVEFTRQFTDDVPPGTADAPVIAANVFVEGNTGTVSLDEIVFTTEGSTDPAADVSEARAALTGQYMLGDGGDAAFFGSAHLNPEGTLSFTGAHTLRPGNNYIGLTYSVAPDATGGHLLDATIESVTAEGVTHAAALTTREGALRIPLPLVNDDLADALPLADTDSQSASNVEATTETGETAASCSQDGGNSVYWVYTPPTDGTIEVSTEGSDFPAILSILTGSEHPLTEQACDSMTGSAQINDFPVTAGTAYYIRVVGQYGILGADAGQIQLDFAFSGTTTSTEDGAAAALAVSSFAPNPFSSAASLTVEVEEAQPVRVTLYTLLGQKVATLFDGPLAAGAERRIRVEAAGLPAGTYLCRIEGTTFQQTRRVTVVR